MLFGSRRTAWRSKRALVVSVNAGQMMAKCGDHGVPVMPFKSLGDRNVIGVAGLDGARLGHGVASVVHHVGV